MIFKGINKEKLNIIEYILKYIFVLINKVLCLRKPGILLNMY